MANLNFKAFQDAIKQYCIDHVDVQHTVEAHVGFVRMESMDEINSITKNQMTDKVIVVVDDFAGRTIGTPDDRQYIQTARLIFLGYALTGTGDNPQEIENAQRKAEEVMLQFEARMWNDYLEDDCGTFKNMMWELTAYDPIGPDIQNHYGWILTINFKNFKPAYDPSKWSN